MATSSHNNTTPHPNVDWSRVKSEHGKPDRAAEQKHEENLAKLDRSVPQEKGGCGR